MNGMSGWALPTSHDGKIGAAGYNKTNVYKIDTNRFALGDYQSVTSQMSKIENDISNLLRFEKITTTLNWK
jgi:hypothetical protein